MPQTAEVDTTTIPHDPEAQAIENQLADTSVADLDIPEQTLDVLVQLNIKSVGEFYDKTNNGENPELIVKAGLPRDAADDVLIAIAKKKGEIEKAAQPKPEKKLPDPTNGANGYERKFKCKIGRVSIGKTTVSCGVKIPVKGQDGKAGYSRDLIDRCFIEAQIDIEINAGEQLELDPEGRKPFHAVGTTGRVSGGGKDASFTLTLPRQSVNYNALTAYAEDEGEIHVNVIDGEAVDEDPDQMSLEQAA